MKHGFQECPPTNSESQPGGDGTPPFRESPQGEPLPILFEMMAGTDSFKRKTGTAQACLLLDSARSKRQAGLSSPAGWRARDDKRWWWLGFLGGGDGGCFGTGRCGTHFIAMLE